MKNKGRKILISILMIIILTLIVEYLIVKSGSIQNKKQIIKEMTQSENEANLQTQINTLNASHNDYAMTVQENKQKITTAITNAGIETTENSTIDVIVENIEKIASQIIETKTPINISLTLFSSGYNTSLGGASQALSGLDIEGYKTLTLGKVTCNLSGTNTLSIICDGSKIYTKTASYGTVIENINIDITNYSKLTISMAGRLME